MVLCTILLIAITFVSGCGPLRYKDVSDKKPYSSVVGLIITSKVELILHGWTEEDFTVKDPIFYQLDRPPGAANRFVKSRTTIPAGLKLEIVAVERVYNLLRINTGVRFRVVLKNIKPEHDIPIYMKRSFLIEEWGRNNEPIIYDHSVFTFFP
jgi:hypothetical protein